MANVAQPNVKEIHWRDGMRITGKHEMRAEDYGQYLVNSGKNKQNGRKRKLLRKN